MKIKILKDIVINGSVELAGTIVDIPDDQAKEAIAFLVAESVEEPPKKVSRKSVKEDPES